MIDNNKGKVDKLTGKRKNIGIIYKGKKFRVKKDAVSYLELISAVEDTEHISMKELYKSLKTVVPDFIEFIRGDEKIGLVELFSIVTVIINICSDTYEHEYFELNSEFFRTVNKAKQESGLK